MLLMSIDPTTGRVAAASVPRDTDFFPRARSNGGGSSGIERVDSMYYFYRKSDLPHGAVDGAALARFTKDVSAALGVEIDGFAMIRFSGFVNLVKKGSIDNSYCDTPANGQPTCRHDNATPYTGMKLAGNVGVGMHAFANNYFAINLELHDLIFKNNAAGRDVTGSSEVNSADLQWTNNWMVGLNFMFFLPAQVKVSR